MERKKDRFVSTSAPLFHPDPARQANVAQAAFSAAPGSDSWKQELNARLREHRQRRADSGTATDHSPQHPRHDTSVLPGRSDVADRAGSMLDPHSSPASRVAARVAERYSNAPSYQQLLATASAAAAAAAESAAEAAYEAHAAAQAVLSEWADSRESNSQHDDFWTERSEAVSRDLSSDRMVHQHYQASSHEPSIGTFGENFNKQPADRSDTLHDAFSDPFFTTPARAFEHPASAFAGSYPQDDLQPADHASHESVSQFAGSPPIPRQLSVEHPQPLPPRTPIPTRRMVVERARSLVDAFAEAVVPAAQSLPAKLIEFPRELVAPRKQRPRLAEGPLFEQESPSVALRIFEVTGEEAGHLAGEAADTSAQPVGLAYAAAATMRDETVSPPSAYASAGHMSRSSGYEDGDHAMVNRNKYDGEHPGAEATPRRRGSFLFGPDSPARSLKQPAQQTGWGSIRLGEHPAPSPIDSGPVAHRSLDNADRSGDDASYGKSATNNTDESAQAYPAPATRPSRSTRPASQAARAESIRENSATHASDLDAPPLHGLAPLSDRCMSALVDGTIIVSCFLLSLLVFTACTTHPPTGKSALAIAFIVLGALATFYAWLFMTYGGGSTPGMRYARIALCSFADENPTRKELQNRIPATALSLLPLGLGLLWALMDEDKLGWHDRMTRTYQRSYR
jgi:uncharacterized RDD family membrane protein YckC